MSILEQICKTLDDGRVEKVCVGANWSAVVAETDRGRRCGLASNPVKGPELNQTRQNALARYQGYTALQLAQLVLDQDKLLAGVGMAAINALLPQAPGSWIGSNAGDLIAKNGKDKRVALVGHFPFADVLRQKVGRLDILELRPREGDLHANLAPEVIPQAEVVAITSMALVNGTMEGLLALCPPEAYVIILGPSTPLSPLLFSAGANLLCGSIVEQIDSVCTSILNGDSFRQVKKNGIRLVAIQKP